MAQTITKTVHHLSIVPLMIIEHSEFATHYERGLAHSLFKTHEYLGPLHDLYFVDTFMGIRNVLHASHSYQQEHLYAHIGLTLGEIHGAVLSLRGIIRSDATTLVALRDEEVTRGYRAGREFYFTEADTEHEWQWTDDCLLQWLRELAQEYERYHDAERTIRFCIGYILGELSERLFPWTPQEQRALEQESIRLLGYVCRINPRSLAAQQLGIQALS